MKVSFWLVMFHRENCSRNPYTLKIFEPYHLAGTHPHCTYDYYYCNVMVHVLCSAYMKTSQVLDSLPPFLTSPREFLA